MDYLKADDTCTFSFIMGSGPSKYNLGDKAVNGESRKSTQDMGKNAPDLYFHETAPPCRAVIMAALGGGVRLNYRKIDIMRGEQKTKEFQRVSQFITALVTIHSCGKKIFYQSIFAIFLQFYKLKKMYVL